MNVGWDLTLLCRIQGYQVNYNRHVITVSTEIMGDCGYPWSNYQSDSKESVHS